MPREEPIEVEQLFASGQEVGQTLVKRQSQLEQVLLVAVMGIMGLLHELPQFKSVILNLYLLPAALGAFYLGRRRGAILSLLCIFSAAFTTLVDLSNPQAMLPPFLDLLTLSVWGSVLFITSCVIGGLSEERSRKFEALHDSHEAGVLRDSLTGTANRRALEYELTCRLNEWDRCKLPLSLILTDIDHFKKFNDTYGHRAGDAVIRDVAATLEDAMRETDLVARFGGEEFAIVLPGIYPSEAKESGERARKMVEESCYRFEGLALRLTVSVGVAHVGEGDDVASLLERADTALYTSKQANRNCTHYHNGDTCEPVGELAEAVTQGPSDLSASDFYTDDLTGLPRGHVLVKELHRRAAEANRHGTTLSLLIVELQDFAEFQRKGMLVEKRALSIVSEAICVTVRASDLVARFLEDQFAVLLPYTTIAGAAVTARRIYTAMQEVIERHDTPLLPHCSIGVAELSSEEVSESLLERVKQASAVAAVEGSGTVGVHDGLSCEVQQLASL